MILVLLWTAASAVGLAFSALGLIDAFADLKSLGPITNGRRSIALSDIRTQALLSVIHFAWLVIGVLVMTTSAEARLNVFTFILIGTNALTALISAMRYYDHAALTANLADAILKEKENK